MRILGVNIVNSRRAHERSNQMTLQQMIDQQFEYFRYGGNLYGSGGLNTTIPGKPQEMIANNFPGYIRGAYKANGIIFACILARMSLFAQGRFQYRRLRTGKPGDLFGNADLVKLERPWPGGQTADLLARMEQDGSLAGNSFTLDLLSRGLRRLRPDWTTIIVGTDSDVVAEDIHWQPDIEVIGYAYTPGGQNSGQDPVVYRAEQVAHYKPIPDPEAIFRGMSWLTPIVTEIMGDKAASEHKLDFFERGGTPNMTIEYDPKFVQDETAFGKWVDAIEDQISRFNSGNRRLHLGMGTTANVVGSNFEEIEFKATQGAGETRIAMAAGVPPVVLGASEGLQGSSLNAGNYQAAMRRFSDLTMGWLWQCAAGALADIVPVPDDAELWVDTRFVPALQSDRSDAAKIQNEQQKTITGLVKEGFTPESSVTAVVNDDWNLLKHTGLPSVQVQKPTGSNGAGAVEEREAIAEAIADEEE